MMMKKSRCPSSAAGCFDIVALERVLIVLGLPEVSSFAQVCKRWARASRSELVWCEFRLARFALYVHKPRVDPGQSTYNTVRAAVLDESRTSPTIEELCSFEWRFRFKRAAGHLWLAVDPYWSDMPPTTVRFHPDGTTTTSSSEFPPGFVDRIEWRWANSKTGKRGSGTPCGSIRANVDGEDVPTYVVSRHPRHKGFVLESCWSLFTAFPMLPKDQDDDPYLDEIGFEHQVAEALQYNDAQQRAAVAGRYAPDYFSEIVEDVLTGFNDHFTFTNIPLTIPFSLSENTRHVASNNTHANNPTTSARNQHQHPTMRSPGINGHTQHSLPMTIIAAAYPTTTTTSLESSETLSYIDNEDDYDSLLSAPVGFPSLSY